MSRYFRPELPMSEPDRCEIVDMCPGFTLFLPRGYWHGTSAEQESISLSFGFAVPSWADVFIGRLKSELAVAEHWRAPATHIGADGGHFQPDDLFAAVDGAITMLMSGELNSEIREEVRTDVTALQREDRRTNIPIAEESYHVEPPKC